LTVFVETAQYSSVLDHGTAVANISCVAPIIDRSEQETLPPAPKRAMRLGPTEQYELIEPIGEGAMGLVWRARDTLLDIDVAIKVLRPELDNPWFSQRLLAEARAAARVRHRATAHIYATGITESSSQAYIVMELLAGRSLEDLLDERGVLSPIEAVRLIVPVVSAAGAAHRAGVVHRDIKPTNIFLAQGEVRGPVRPKLLDFGVAKLMDGRPLFEVEPGTVLGTPTYMSPEQAMGREDVDGRCDVWAICAVLYEMLSGSPPFEADSYNELVHTILTVDPRPLDIDPALWTILERGLAKDPDARWSDGHALGRALATWLMGAGHEHDITHAAIRHSSMFPPPATPPPLEPVSGWRLVDELDATVPSVRDLHAC